MSSPPESSTFIEQFLTHHDEPCPKCTYSLRGLKGDTCPECGHIVRLGVVRFRPVMPKAAIWLAGIILVLTAAGSVWTLYLYSSTVFPPGLGGTFLRRLYIAEGARLFLIPTGIILALRRRKREGAAGRFFVVYTLAFLVFNAIYPFIFELFFF